MNILKEITDYKRTEVEARKTVNSRIQLEKRPLFTRETTSLSKQLKRSDRVGIIAEFKRHSPSEKWISKTSEVSSTTQGYFKAGASGVSVLTDTKYFKGVDNDLMAAREANTGPILRKDFVVDEYQIIEARSIGADAILLIAACLSPQETKQFGQIAQSLGLEVLLEVRDSGELETHVNPYIDLLGV
ncbi:MAG: indole-3-glycerol-phosphate synthase, partial [Flavobacteriales bacterium]|nr:indole-3-glycerol-phosphate synthase [Flavobacteriales bacterium]